MPNRRLIVHASEDSGRTIAVLRFYPASGADEPVPAPLEFVATYQHYGLLTPREWVGDILEELLAVVWDQELYKHGGRPK